MRIDNGLATGSFTVSGSLLAPNITGSLFGTASWARNVVSASYANNSTNSDTASYSDNFTVKSKLTIDQTITDNARVLSSVVGSNNLFTQATGSYTSAFFKYTAANGTNARSGEVIVVWNEAVSQYTDFSTLDVGSTTAVTASAAIVAGDVQFNIQTNTSGWTIKSLATFI